MRQCTWTGGALALRAATEPMSLAQTMRTAIGDIDKDLPITSVRTMEQILV